MIRPGDEGPRTLVVLVVGAQFIGNQVCISEQTLLTAEAIH